MQSIKYPKRCKASSISKDAKHQVSQKMQSIKYLKRCKASNISKDAKHQISQKDAKHQISQKMQSIKYLHFIFHLLPPFAIPPSIIHY